MMAGLLAFLGMLAGLVGLSGGRSSGSVSTVEPALQETPPARDAVVDGPTDEPDMPETPASEPVIVAPPTETPVEPPKAGPDPVEPVPATPDPVTPPKPDPVMQTPDPVDPDPKPDPVISPKPDPVPAPVPVDPDPVEPDSVPVEPAPKPDPVAPSEPDPVPPVDPGPVSPPQPDPRPDPAPQPDGPPIVTDTLRIAGGRVTTVETAGTGEVAGIEITRQPEFGHASVNPDNTIALVLSGETATGPIGLGYTLTYADGTAEAFSSSFEVDVPTQDAGWGAGEHYVLETGADGHVVVETGENHRNVYIGGTDAALSRADIARMEGLDAGQIDRDWLIEHPEYGGSEAMALDADAGMDVWYGITSNKLEPSSHWLRLEAGHDYEDLDRVIGRGSMGESELHPLHITSWGEGEAPVIVDTVKVFQLASANVVFSGVTLGSGVFALASWKTLTLPTIRLV